MQNITDYVHPIFGIDGNGFLPLNGEIDQMKIREEKDEKLVKQVDSTKLEFISKLIDESKGVEMIFVASPIWYGSSDRDYQPISEICESKNVRFIDFSNSEKYVRQSHWFKDGTHLNARGADEFTRDLTSVIN